MWNLLPSVPCFRFFAIDFLTRVLLHVSDLLKMHHIAGCPCTTFGIRVLFSSGLIDFMQIIGGRQGGRVWFALDTQYTFYIN